MKGGWVSATLGDVLDVLKNGVNCKQDKNGCGQKISRIESIANATFDCGRVGYAELSEPDKVKYRLQQGDILFSHINSAIHVGKTAVFDAEDDVYHGVNLLLMRPKSYLSSAYLELYLKYIFEQGYWRTICKQSVNQASVNQQDIKRVPLRFPKERAEQKRIVAILDETFEGISQAVTNGEKNLANARELFDSYLNSVFAQKGEGWVEKRLGDASTVSYGYTAKAKQDKVGPRFLRITDITTNGVDWDTVPFCQINEKDHQKHRLRTGDIVFARTGATTGKSYLVSNPPNAVCASYLIRLSLRDETVLPDFLILFFQTKQYWEFIGKGISGSAQGGFNASKLSELSMPLPSLTAQKSIIKQVGALQAQTQQLKTIYQRKITAIAELKQSILQKAFDGELTTDGVQQKVNA